MSGGILILYPENNKIKVVDMKELIAIQKELKAPKGQTNAFGKYKYRSCEDILEAVKPLCIKHNCLLTISDEMVMLGDRFYVKATAVISLTGTIETLDKLNTVCIEGLNKVSVSAYARESESKKGMDASQITGSASSYARKYSLNGLFCIDDTKDADTMDNTAQPQHKAMTGKQKGTLKDQLIALEAIGSESSKKAIAVVDDLLFHNKASFDDAAHLINKVKLTIEQA